MMRRGMTIIEVVVASSLFALFVTSFLGAYTVANRAARSAEARSRATFIAEEGVEAVRNIRDARFKDLAPGTYGLALVGGVWQLVPTPDVTDIFTRTITIAIPAANPAIPFVPKETRDVHVDVVWRQNNQINGEVHLQTFLTNWRGSTIPEATLLTVNFAGVNITGAGKQLVGGIKLGNTSAEFGITVDKVRVTWQKAALRIRGVSVANVPKWSSTGVGTPSGDQVSNTTLDLVDFDIASSTTALALEPIAFSADVSKQKLTLLFTMGDGTTKTVSNILLP